MPLLYTYQQFCNRRSVLYFDPCRLNISYVNCLRTSPSAVETCSMECPGGECVVGENGESTCVCRVGQFFDESAASCTCELYSVCVMCAFVQGLCVCNCHHCTFMRPWIQCGCKSYFCTIRVNPEFEGRTLNCS